MPWQGEELIQRAYAGVTDALGQFGETVMVPTLYRINAERAWLTGDMSRGWEVVGVVRLGSIVRLIVSNGVHYAVYIDRGTVFIAPRNISGSAMDEAAPRLPGIIAARLGAL